MVVTFAPEMCARVVLSRIAMAMAPATSIAPSLVVDCPLPRSALFAFLLFYVAPPLPALACAVTVDCWLARIDTDAAVEPVASVESMAATVFCCR